MPFLRNGPADALVLFDIDGTLIRRAGPHHREALVEAIRRTCGLETTTELIPVQGMLDRDIVTLMLRNAGATDTFIRRQMPLIVRQAQTIYVRTCPDLQRKVCPGVRRTLRALQTRRVPAGLVTGNLTRIAWKKMEHAGLKDFFRFGAFAEMARTRTDLVRMAARQARQEGWINGKTRISLVGDHPNDIAAAKANSVQSIAVATGIASADELAACKPDVLLPDLRSFKMELVL